MTNTQHLKTNETRYWYLKVTIPYKNSCGIENIKEK